MRIIQYELSSSVIDRTLVKGNKERPLGRSFSMPVKLVENKRPFGPFARSPQSSPSSGTNFFSKAPTNLSWSPESKPFRGI